MAGCATVALPDGSTWNAWTHSLQQARGHVQLISSARGVQEVADDPNTEAALRQRLLLAQSIRGFAVSELHLPDGSSYRRFARLGRAAVVWNVVAAPEFSLQLKPWCFPVAGCVGYLGYFDQAQAQTMARRLRDHGWEVAVYPVPAYSTLGRTDWLGGDPLLDTFIYWPEAQLARLIFHEMAHQVVYVPGDTAFNESFATAVERLGWLRWQQHRGLPIVDDDGRAQQFAALTQRAREDLSALYAQPMELSVKRQRKQARLQQLQDQYAVLRQSWSSPAAGYDAWMSSVNNASLGAQGVYHDQVDHFLTLFERCKSDFPCFYSRVRELAAQSASDRSRHLKALGPWQ
jgi:predicted aminopeptidase